MDEELARVVLDMWNDEAKSWQHVGVRRAWPELAQVLDDWLDAELGMS